MMQKNDVQHYRNTLKDFRDLREQHKEKYQYHQDHAEKHETHHRIYADLVKYVERQLREAGELR